MAWCTRADLKFVILTVPLSAWFGLGLGLGCGPSAEPTEPEHGSSTAHGASSTGASSTSSATEGLDESGSSTGPAGTVPLYDACEGQGQADCLPGLLCAPIATDPDGTTSICTVECHDPAVDCAAPPDGFEAVCNGFLHMFEPDPFCAIGCTETGECPAGMECASEVPPYTEPFYCVPS